MKCESDGCRQYAEFYNPMDNKLCSDCIQMAVETGEYSWNECKSIPRGMNIYDIPQCCKNCSNFDDDYDEWRDVTYFFCTLNVAFPTRKKTCKRQNQ